MPIYQDPPGKEKSGVRNLLSKFNPFEFGDNEDSFQGLEKPLGYYEESIFQKVQRIMAKVEEEGKRTATIKVGENREAAQKIKEQGYIFNLKAEGETLFVFNGNKEQSKPENVNQQRADLFATKRTESYQTRRTVNKESTFKEFRGFVSETAANLGSFAEKNVIKQTPEAGKDLFEQFTGIPFPTIRKKEEKKPLTPEEAAAQAKKKAEAIALYQAYQKIDQVKRESQDQKARDFTKKALGITGQGYLSGADKEMLGYSSSADENTTNTDANLHRLDRIRRERIKQTEKARERARDQEIQKPVVNLNAVAEGGTGGGKVNISTTGGVGAG